MNKKITHNSFQKIVFLLILLLGITSQLFAQRNVEKLNRGLVAMRLNSSQVYIGWRMLGTEPTDVSYNLYCNDVKVTGSPFTTTTNFTHNITTNGTYTVRAIINGVEEAASEAASVWANQYFDIAMQIPPGGTNLSGSYTYNVNDCSVGDVDGDGQYEIFVKWDPSNSQDNSLAGYTGNVYIDCYRLDGTRLWRIDLGKNIRAGAHYTQFIVYDLDSDGKAEIAFKTADGTIDGTGVVIGSSTADYRNSDGYILSGPEFLTVFNGETGKAMSTTNYLPARGTLADWGDTYGNRVDRFIAAVAYLDGEKPSLIMGRGYYTGRNDVGGRMVRVAWDWKNNNLTQRWIFDSKNSGNAGYVGMGNHQMTIGDSDGDGKDEIFNGSSAINDDGTGLFANTLGHGDALHMSDMDPDRPGLEIFQCLEEPAKYKTNGMVFLDAKTGAPLWGISGEGIDIGRCNAADIDPRYKGYECWGSRGGLFDCKGNQIGTSKPSMNFSIWWDADLSRELLDDNRIDKWNHLAGNNTRLLTATGYDSNNTTKATPCLSADLFGDWREEVILRKEDNTAIRIYTTKIPTTHKLYTLMHDTQYRVAIAWQNSAYNQPPHPSFYLGTDMAAQTKPNIVIAGANLSNKDFSNTPTSANAVVYPNPTSQTFTIAAEGKFTYTIHNILGQEIGNGKGETQVEVGEISAKSGVYIISVKSEKGISTIKLIKD